MDELRGLAKSLGLRGWTSLRKAELIELLDKHAKSVEPVVETSEEVKPEDVKVPEVKERRRDQRARQAKAKADKEAGLEPELKPKPVRKSAEASPWQLFLKERREAGDTLKVAMTKKAEYAEYKSKFQPKQAVEA
jgi:hypothetical protein